MAEDLNFDGSSDCPSKKPCQKKPGSSIQYINSQPPAPFFVMISSEAWWLGGSYRTPVTTPVLQHGRECRRRRYGAGARRGAFGGRKQTQPELLDLGSWELWSVLPKKNVGFQRELS